MFIQELSSKLEIQCKKPVYFSFDFGWYSICFDIVRWELGRGGIDNTHKIHNMSSFYFFGNKLFFFYAANAILGLPDHVDSIPI